MQPGEVPQIVEHLFRNEAGKMVATLTRVFGIEHLSLAEDVVQETLIKALQTWPFYGIPKNPSAWMMRASRNLALDVVRREKRFREKQPEIIQLMEREETAPDATAFAGKEIADDRLRMMFVCAHPAIPPEAQVALALKTLCGFSITEVSRAFLTSEAAIAKRLVRAKQHIRDAKIPFEIPSGEELPMRLGGVLQSLYFLFNEGYKASSGEDLVRDDLCREAIRLATLLAEHPVGDQPKTHALLALMLLNTARNAARTDGEGNLLRLEDQDRSRWDQPMIARGMFHFARSAAGNELTQYHLQAGIAACHCAAADYDSTDWRKILSFYERLIELEDSPVVALNRAIVIANIDGPAAGMKAVSAIRNLEKLSAYHLLYAALGEFEFRLGRWPEAAKHFRRSLDLAEIESEKRFLAGRLSACENAATSSPSGRMDC